MSSDDLGDYICVLFLRSVTNHYTYRRSSTDTAAIYITCTIHLCQLYTYTTYISTAVTQAYKLWHCGSAHCGCVVNGCTILHIFGEKSNLGALQLEFLTTKYK